MTSGTLRRLGLSAAFLVVAAAVQPVRAGEGDVLKLEAQLVWGTDLDKSSSPDHKLIDEKTAADLKKVFKWKNYFVINTLSASFTKDKMQRLEMSENCALDITSLGTNRLEVLIYGKGVLVAKGTQSLPPGERWFLMGLSEDESSWLVILKQQSE